MSEQGIEMEPQKEILEISDIEEPINANTYRFGSYDGNFIIDFGLWLESNKVKVLARINLADQQIWNFAIDMLSSCLMYEKETGKKVIPEDIRAKINSGEE